MASRPLFTVGWREGRALGTSEDNAMNRIKFISLLGSFPKLRKATVSFIITLCPSYPLSVWNNSVTTGMIFMKFNICVFFENASRNSDKNNGYST